MFMDNDEKRWLQVTFPRRMFYSLMWNVLSVLTGFSEDNLTSTSGWMSLICMPLIPIPIEKRPQEKEMSALQHILVCAVVVWHYFWADVKKNLLSLDENITDQINNISKVQLGERYWVDWQEYWWRITYRSMAKSMTVISPKTYQRIGKDSWSWNPGVLCMICRWLEGLESLIFFLTAFIELHIFLHSLASPLSFPLPCDHYTPNLLWRSWLILLHM